MKTKSNKQQETGRIGVYDQNYIPMKLNEKPFTTMPNTMDTDVMEINADKDRYPYCIVWTPLPVLTWIIPIIGHMGIAYSNGIITDFAGPYFVSRDSMAFGRPTKYWQLEPDRVAGGTVTWDEGITKASEVYMNRMHNLFCDNCHSHVACALNSMKYNGDSNYNMLRVWFWFTLNSRYVSFGRFLQTWLPFVIIIAIVLCFYLLF